MPALNIISFVAIILFGSQGNASFENSLITLHESDCHCPGTILTFECTVVGAGSTVWQGSAFECTFGEIILLRHTQFASGGAVGVCNDGSIIARGVSVENTNCFTSQLNVTLRTILNGRIIECAYDNTHNITVIGGRTINVTSSPYPPPGGIHLSHVGEQLLTFNWSPSTSSCRGLVYNIVTSNCGICPSNTMGTSATCVSVPTDGTMCTFGIQTVVCTNISSQMSNTVAITLKVPEIPAVKAVPSYSNAGRRLSDIMVSFNETVSAWNFYCTTEAIQIKGYRQQESFVFSNRISGAAISYTVNYTDSTSGRACGVAIVPPSACRSGACSHTLQASTSPCFNSSGITVTVYATNALGNGQTSAPITIGTTNNFVDVIVDLPLSAFVCKFSDHEANTPKTCTVSYGPGESCDDLSRSGQAAATSESVLVHLPALAQDSGSRYCYVVTASNGSFTAKVTGTFNTVCNPSALGSVDLLPADANCHPPLHSLGITDGIVCYTGTAVGSVAFYSCNNCGFNAITGPSVRTCTGDGRWNGTTPQCNCSSSTSNKGSQSGITIALVIVILLSLIILVPFAVSSTAVAVRTSRAKAKLEKELEARTTIYEDITDLKQLPQTMDTSENVAYATRK